MPAGNTIYVIGGLMIAGLIVLGLARYLIRRWGVRLPTSIESWKSYVRGQGAVLLGFLLIGGAGSALSVRYGPSPSYLAKGGNLIEYRAVNPSERFVYGPTESIEEYSDVFILSRVTAPANGSAVVGVIRSSRGEPYGDINRFETISSSWSRLELKNTAHHMRVLVEPPVQSGSVPATSVDVLVYLAR